jgi:hypothetical protein
MAECTEGISGAEADPTIAPPCIGHQPGVASRAGGGQLAEAAQGAPALDAAAGNATAARGDNGDAMGQPLEGQAGERRAGPSRPGELELGLHPHPGHEDEDSLSPSTEGLPRREGVRVAGGAGGSYPPMAIPHGRGKRMIQRTSVWQLLHVYGLET